MELKDAAIPLFQAYFDSYAKQIWLADQEDNVVSNVVLITGGFTRSGRVYSLSDVNINFDIEITSGSKVVNKVVVADQGGDPILDDPLGSETYNVTGVYQLQNLTVTF